jgi:HEXXH motif-containing protein
MDIAFAPSPARALQLDAAVRHALADSIDRIVATLDGALDCDSDSLAALTAFIRAHPVRPGVMALYGSLVPALFDDEPRARAVLAALARPEWRCPVALRMVTVSDADLGEGIAASYLDHLNDDPEQNIGLSVPEPARALDAERKVRAALALLHRAHPAMGGEFAAIINEIILAGPSAEPGRLALHGASSFYLWGGLLLNIEAFPTRISLVEGLAHESAHSLLHGLTMGEKLVLDDGTDRHRSPLRDDSRPMDGIVHATYVLARMHMALAAVLRSDALDAAERDAASSRLVDVARDYAEGLAVVASAARFTANGAAIFAGAEAYMAASAGIERQVSGFS